MSKLISYDTVRVCPSYDRECGRNRIWWCDNCPKEKFMREFDLNKALHLNMDIYGTNITIGDYLRKLLKTLLVEGESFDSKRPFGDSGWALDLYIPLIKANFIKGKIDEDGCIVSMDYKEADKFILKLVDYIFYKASDDEV